MSHLWLEDLFPYAFDCFEGEETKRFGDGDGGERRAREAKVAHGEDLGWRSERNVFLCIEGVVFAGGSIRQLVAQKAVG